MKLYTWEEAIHKGLKKYGLPFCIKCTTEYPENYPMLVESINLKDDKILARGYCDTYSNELFEWTITYEEESVHKYVKEWTIHPKEIWYLKEL